MESKGDDQRPGLADAAARAAFFPARAAARVWRDQLEAAADDVLSAPEIARVVDRALAGSLPEDVAHSLVRHRVIERVVVELARSGELERLLTSALASPRTLELTDRVLASEETQHALGQVASSPEVRKAVAKQTTGLAYEVADGVRAAAARCDGSVEHMVRRREVGTTRYAGVVTRFVAAMIDLLLALGIYMAVTAGIALIASLVGDLHPQWLVNTLVGSGWVVIAFLYFVLFWSTTGQTPGMRVLKLRVRKGTGGVPSIGRSIVRLIGLVISIVPFFVGFVPILFDSRRRGLADFMAGTVVEYDDSDPDARG